MARPTYARISLDAAMHNVRAVKELVGGRPVCAAVKADAYGHGAPAVARAMSAAGVDMFGVAMTEEAVELRECGIREPVILLTSVPAGDIGELLARDITACIADEGFARSLSERALRMGVTARAHVNVDTGMRRVGIEADRAVETILRIAALPALELTGIFSHFACSDAADQRFSREQLRRFRALTCELASGGMELPLLHMANSGAVVNMPDAYLGGVRTGLVLYGLWPRCLRARAELGLHLKPALSLHTEISFCKAVPAGEALGYGHTFRTERPSVIATLPVGYHDGYTRQYSNCGEVLVRGQRARVVGRVCMDQTLVDVTDVPGAATGDKVVLYGEQQGSRIAVEEMARLVDCVPYELTCSVGGRVRRQYVLGGAVVGETPMRSLVPPSLVAEMFSVRPGTATAGERADAA